MKKRSSNHDPASVTHCALRLLSRREHSRVELKRKLLAKGGEIEQVEAVLRELTENHLQNDERFAAEYLHSRQAKGFGPRRIAAELAQRGIETPPESCANEHSDEWVAVLTRVWQKKFRGQRPVDLLSRAEQTRFLVSRGFAPEQVHQFLAGE